VLSSMTATTKGDPNQPTASKSTWPLIQTLKSCRSKPRGGLKLFVSLWWNAESQEE
jgi:hypothetical protein